MKVSTKGRYALRMMVDLAIHQKDGNISLKEIANRQEISIKYLEQIVSPLTKAGYIKSIRGAQGGYTLAKEANEYTAYDILTVVEGSLACVKCLENQPNKCLRYKQCHTVKLYEGLNKVIKDYLTSVTLEMLCSMGGL